MCYSLSIFSDIRALIRRFGASSAKSLSQPRYYYISAFALPRVPVIANDEPELIQTFRWGLVPYWVKGEERANEIRQKTFNARFETLSHRPSFKEAFREHRCLVLVDGFFEFREVGGRKYPYFIRLKSGEPFALAGIWDVWSSLRTGIKEKTFSIVTVTANEMLSRIHNTKRRMPIILEQGLERTWLSRPLKGEEVEDMERQFDKRILEAYPVSKRITSRNIDPSQPELIRPHDYPELEGI